MNAVSINRTVPARLPMRALVRVENWLDFKSYGFLKTNEGETVSVHAEKVAVRLGIGQRLLKGETVCATFHAESDGRLRATKIEFP